LLGYMSIDDTWDD